MSNQKGSTYCWITLADILFVCEHKYPFYYFQKLGREMKKVFFFLDLFLIQLKAVKNSERNFDSFC